MVLSYDKAQKQSENGPISEPATTLTLAGDFGYSTAQLYGSIVDVNQPSYYLELTSQYLPDTPEQGVFSYLKGDSEELLGRTFAVGSVAHLIDPVNCRKNADSTENKIESSLIMLLGLLTYQRGLPSQRLRVNILTCLQKVTPELKGLVVERLRGTHQIKYGNRTLTVEVEPLGCADEGLGVLAATPHVDHRQDIVVISLGGGTTNVSQFGGGKLLTQKPFDGGVMRLYEQIAMGGQVTAALGGVGDCHRIREGVERRDFFYGKAASPDRFSFEDDYYAQLAVWVAQVLARPLQHAKGLLMGADKGLVFGGGAMLPGLKESLSKHGYEIAPDPVNCNVRGLYEFAKGIVARNGRGA